MGAENVFMQTGNIMRAEIEKLKAELREARAEIERLEALEQAVAEYDAETALVPLGDESRSLGRSVYNWRRSVVRAIREKAAAIRAGDGAREG